MGANMLSAFGLSPENWWYVSDALKAIGPLILGCLAFWVARRQMKISQTQADIAKEQAANTTRQVETATRKLNFELFDRRFKVYSVAREYALDLATKEPRGENRSAYIDSHDQARFMFEPEMYDFLDDLLKLGDQMESVHKEVRNAELTGKAEEGEQAKKRLKELAEAALACAGRLAERFYPYINLNQIKAK